MSHNNDKNTCSKSFAEKYGQLTEWSKLSI